MIKKSKERFIFTCFLFSSICFLFVALMNFLDGNTTIGVTFLLLGLSFLILSTTHIKKVISEVVDMRIEKRNLV